jgi:hypothetical protein
VLKDFELIAIVSVQPILRSKPDEALIVLHYLGYPGLRLSSSVESRVKRIPFPSTTGRVIV